MKITKKQLKRIIKEELAAIQELGPETGHEEGTDAVDVVKMIGDDLIEVAGEMREMPSHIPASNVAGFIESKGKEALEAHAELAGGADLAELQSDPAYDPDPSQPGQSAGEYGGLEEIGYELGLIAGKMAGVPELEKWTTALDTVLVKIQALQAQGSE
jgi:hypothetical protein